MNREIKFRAWLDGNMYYNHSVTLQIDGTVSYLTTQGEWVQDEAGVVTLMQFTGLFDKSDNEIYEGDILKNEHSNPLTVIFQDAKFCFLNEQNSGSDALSEGRCIRLEIIGNIYETPDLLTPTSTPH